MNPLPVTKMLNEQVAPVVRISFHRRVVRDAFQLSILSTPIPVGLSSNLVQEVRVAVWIGAGRRNMAKLSVDERKQG